MPKSGSMSLMKYLLCRNFSTASHMDCYDKKKSFQKWDHFCGSCIRAAVRKNVSLDITCGYHSAYSQLDYPNFEHCIFPQMSYLSYFVKFYPNAKFILLGREPQSWVRSVRGWVDSMHLRLLHCFLVNGAYKIPSLMATPKLRDNLKTWEKLYEKYDGDRILREVFVSHTHTVLDYFSEYPEKLLYVNITDCRLEEKLGIFLDLEQTDLLKFSCFGHYHARYSNTSNCA